MNNPKYITTADFFSKLNEIKKNLKELGENDEKLTNKSKYKIIYRYLSHGMTIQEVTNELYNRALYYTNHFTK